jgi:hypothetical protein
MQAAADLPGERGVGAGVEGHGQHDHHQQREEQHAVDGVLGAPLQPEVLAKVREEVACVAHTVIVAVFSIPPPPPGKIAQSPQQIGLSGGLRLAVLTRNGPAGGRAVLMRLPHQYIAGVKGVTS